MKISVVLLLLISSFTAVSHAETPDNDACIASEQVIGDLKKEQENLKNKQNEITEREAELKKRESALEEQLAKLQELRKDVEKINALHSKENEEKISKVVETVEKMSPKNAAKLLASVDERLAVTAMQRINSVTLAKIMNSMEGQKLAQLTELLAMGKKSAPSRTPTGGTTQ